MKLSRLTGMTYGVSAALTLATAGVLYLSAQAIGVERDAVSRQAEFGALGRELAAASDYLTNEARRYSVFGDKVHFDNYWREVNETKTRDHVVARLVELGAPQSELDLIEQAKANSDALIATEDAAMQAVAEGDLERARRLMFGPDYDRDKATIMAPLDEFQSQLKARVDGEVAAARHRADLMSTVAYALVGLTALGFMAILHFVLGRRTVRPLIRIGGAVRQLAEGDFTVAVPERDRDDELGELARAVEVFKANAAERQALEAANRAEAEAKTQRVQRLQGLIARFEQAISERLQEVARSAAELKGTAAAMSGTAADSARQASSAAADSDHADQGVQSVAAASEQLSKSIQEIGLQVTNSQAIAQQAVHEADRTNLTVNSLVDAAQKVGQVVELISAIAGQTNLLALNATIEAARAGEAGKGFAVVASEVKSLANQTAKATEQIATQIAAIQAISGESASAISGIGGTIRRIDEIATGIAAAVEQQNAASAEIARNIQQAATGTRGVSAMIGSMNDAASETGSAAAQLLAASGGLAKQAEAMQGAVAGFLSDIRAA